MSVRNLVLAETKGKAQPTNALLREEGVAGEKEKKGELY